LRQRCNQMFVLRLQQLHVWRSSLRPAPTIDPSADLVVCGLPIISATDYWPIRRWSTVIYAQLTMNFNIIGLAFTPNLILFGRQGNCRLIGLAYTLSKKRKRSPSRATRSTGWRDLRVCSPQPDTSFLCKIAVTGLAHRVVCLFTPQLL